MPFQIIYGDLTEVKTDAIVNAANTALQMGGGVCGAIFRKAGEAQLQAVCNALGGCPTGGAVITPGFQLPASYVIHTVGPIYRGGGNGEAQLLASCYEKSLALAASEGLSSIAFPLISAGIYGYPKEEALDIAKATIEAFLKTHDLTVYLVLFS